MSKELIQPLETVTGQLVNLENPDPKTINIEDIAWGLSRMSRFCGHTITVVPYNVAQHSVSVAEEVQRLLKRPPFVDNFPSDLKIQYKIILKALIHDAAEVYTGDMPSPIKHIPEFRLIIKRIEHGLMMAIYESLGIKPPTEAEENLIKTADRICQKVEAHAFMPSRGRHWPNLPEVSLERLQQFEAPISSLDAYKLFKEKFNMYSSAN